MGSQDSAMDFEGDGAWSLSQFTAATRRRWPLLVAVLAVCLALGTIVSLLQARFYTAQVRVAVEPAGQRDALERVLFGTSDLGTQKQILMSTPLVSEVLKNVGARSDDASVRAFVRGRVTTEVLIDTTVVQVTVKDTDPQRAAQLAQGLAEQYLAYLERDAEVRVREVQADLAAEEQAARLQLKSLDQQLASDTDARTQTSLEDERDDLFAKLRFIVARRVELETAQALARRGTIIEPASANALPVSPNVPLNLLLAAALGLTLGGVLVAVRARSDDRLYEPEHVRSQVLGTPVLAAPGTQAADEPDGLRTTGAAADFFQRLHLLLGSATQPDRLTSVAVCSAGDDDRAGSVAVGLARAVADGGDCVVLIDANLRNPAAAPLLGVTGPGLGELVLDRNAQALQLIQRVEGVAVLPAGQAPEQGPARLRRPQLEAVVTSLHCGTDAVVMAAPPVRTAAETLEIAGAAGQAVVVVVLGRTTSKELAESLDQLAEVGAKVRAVVCLPR
jgi:non-specific protein-tyrosine kinase